MVDRILSKRLEYLTGKFPVVGIIGPRQVGKTTLAKEFLKTITKSSLYLDLEKTSDIDKLRDPELFLSNNSEKCIVIDEIQNKPELFPLLRALVDEHRVPLRYIILGSASPGLLRQSSQSLAGRIAYLELCPFNFIEIKNITDVKRHHLFGGFPESLLSEKAEDGWLWLENFINTYIYRDLQQLGLKADAAILRRLWEMMAWLNGNMLNYQLIGKSLDLSGPTISTYISFFENAFLVRKLQPFHYNIKKRLVKSPKIYLNDTGILHKLLRISDYDQLLGHTSVGASWEAYVVNQIYSLLTKDLELFFYRTHNGAEVDIVFVKALQPVATAEIKFTSMPHPSKGLINCIQDLNSANNYIITPFSDDYLTSANIRVCSLPVFLEKYLDGI
ncbi:MAG: ATP-binding protein [Bacteroidales bacterium]|nr:ATP-binding protein [Bacteroidales bacterium]